MITLEKDSLVFRFPEVHADAVCRIGFQRTLRIPDDGRDYPLPPGLGAFPLRHLDDHAARLPEEWRRRGGVIMPMYQAEAMWLHFGGGRGWGDRGGDLSLTSEVRGFRVDQPLELAAIEEDAATAGALVDMNAAPLVRAHVGAALGTGEGGGGHRHSSPGDG